MTTFSTLAAMTLLTAEQSAVQVAVGYEDAQGMLSAVNNEVAQLTAKLTRINSFMPSGTNKTAIAACITALA